MATEAMVPGTGTTGGTGGTNFLQAVLKLRVLATYRDYGTNSTQQ